MDRVGKIGLAVALVLAALGIAISQLASGWRWHVIEWGIFAILIILAANFGGRAIRHTETDQERRVREIHEHVVDTPNKTLDADDPIDDFITKVAVVLQHANQWQNFGPLDPESFRRLNSSLDPLLEICPGSRDEFAALDNQRVYQLNHALCTNARFTKDELERYPERISAAMATGNRSQLEELMVGRHVTSLTEMRSEYRELLQLLGLAPTRRWWNLRRR